MPDPIPARADARPPTWLLAALLVLVAFLFWDALRGQVLFDRDLHLMLWGQARSFEQAVVQDGWPLWDAFRGFGEPLLANPNAQALYPTTWLNLAMSPLHAYTVYAVFHVLLAAGGLVFWGRTLGMSWGASLATALVGVAAGPFVALVNLWHHFAGAAWLPWALGAAEATLRTPRWSRTLGWAAVLTLQALAGSADLCLMTVLLSLAIPLRHLWLRPGHGRTLRALGAGAAAAILAVGGSAPMWLPALELVRASERAALSESLRTYWSVNPWTLLQLVVPLFPQELPLRRELFAVFFDPREPFLGSIYLGSAALPLVAMSLLGPRRRLGLGVAMLAFLAVAISLGRFGVVYDLAVTVFPPLNSFRYPSKAMIAVAFLWATLAGLGFDAWKDAASWRSRARQAGVFIPTALVLALPLGAAAIWLVHGGVLAGAAFSPDAAPLERERAVTSITLALLCASGLALLAALVAVWARRDSSRGPYAAAALCALATVDLAAAHRSLNATAASAAFLHPPPALRALRADHVDRLFVFDYAARILGKHYRRTDPVIPLPGRRSETAPRLRQALAYQAFLTPPVASRWGVRGGFEHDWMGLKPKPARNLMLVLRATEETPDFLRLLEVGAVTHVAALHRAGLESLEALASFDDEDAGTVHLFRVPDPLPRSYAVGSARQADGLAALRLLTDPTFDPRREIVVPEGAATGNDRFPGLVAATIVAESPNRVRLEADLPADGYVVLVDAYDPGWTARVDAGPAPVLRANVGFRAVRVPRGRHLVEFEYWPRGLTGGLWLALGTAVALTGVVVFGRRRDRPPVTS